MKLKNFIALQKIYSRSPLQD